MDDVLTIKEIETQFTSEWILVTDPNTNDSLEVKSGKVRWIVRIAMKFTARLWNCMPSASPCFTQGQCPKIPQSYYEGFLCRWISWSCGRGTLTRLQLPFVRPMPQRSRKARLFMKRRRKKFLPGSRQFAAGRVNRYIGVPKRFRQISGWVFHNG
jgi:hypothetical protein